MKFCTSSWKFHTLSKGDCRQWGHFCTLVCLCEQNSKPQVCLARTFWWWSFWSTRICWWFPAFRAFFSRDFCAVAAKLLLGHQLWVDAPDLAEARDTTHLWEAGTDWLHMCKSKKSKLTFGYLFCFNFLRSFVLCFLVAFIRLWLIYGCTFLLVLIN